MGKEPFNYYQVFYSYSHIDERFLKELRDALAPLKRQGIISEWYDRMISPGAEWETTLNNNLEKADLVILLVSPSFFTSDYCYGEEMRRALERYYAGEAIVIPVIVRPCVWTVTSLKKLQVLPEDGKAVTIWDDRDQAWTNVAEGIRKAIDTSLPPSLYRKLCADGRNALLDQTRADVTSQVKLHNLPIKPTNVVGRDNELRHILKTLSESNKPLIITSGFGGIGKSTLAKMVAWTCLEPQEPFDFVAWVDTRQYDKSQVISLNFILDEIAKAADVSSDIPSISNLEVKQDKIRELLKSHRSLLILDNYESLLADPKEEHKVSLFLNSLPIGPITGEEDTYIRTLITTREVSPSLRALPIDDMRLQQLSLEDSLKLMKSRTPARLRLTDDQYKRVWELLCGLPKYMQIAIDQLRSITFEQWERMVKDIEVPLDEGERFFRDIFEHSWKRFTDDFRKILMSMSYFVGEASPDALRKTSGLSERRFSNVLASASDAYIESTGTGYTVHPLTHAFCRAVLKSNDTSEFREQSSLRFVEYFLDFARMARESNQSDLLEREIRNIVAAARLADNLQTWSHLIGFRDNTTTFLRIRGYWQEQTEITELAAKACRELGEKQALAECLVDDLSWLFLRFEELEKAEGYIREGLKLFQELGHREGMAQATRHLGKSALLKGLNLWYEPDESWEKHSTESERHYSESLRIREELQQEGLDQRSKIADMKLDFGRLYWLQGRKYERDGRARQDRKLIDTALRKYDQANKVSEEAKDLFEEIGEITNIETIAVGSSIRILTILRKRYGTGRWRKRKGIATVRLADGTVRPAEINLPQVLNPREVEQPG